jgi:hypothetical protein
MTDITISDITNATATDVGTGSFDVLMNSVALQIQKQFDEQRITGGDYATVYLGGLQAVLTQSMSFAMQQEEAGLKADLVTEQISKVIAETDAVIGTTAKLYAEIALLDQKQVTEKAQTTDPTGGLTQSQQQLFQAQVKGFTGKHENELLKIYLDTWAVVYSINDGDLSGTEFGIPSFVLEASPTVTLPPLIDAQAVVSAAVYD